MSEEDVVTILIEISNKLDQLTKALTAHWKDEVAKRRERCW